MGGGESVEVGYVILEEAGVFAEASPNTAALLWPDPD